MVGIGASAGGLEALEQFFQQVPPLPGVAFVVIQHMDPTRRGMMVELLQRSTSLKVLQARDGMRVQSDRVYVIPPNKDMSMLHGTLQLLEPAAKRGLRLPIDHFFRSLADDQKWRAVGVVLSGMGSDGTQGLRAIKEQAGAAFVQSPASAKFDGMPQSALDAGLDDVVAPPGELPSRILAFLAHASEGTHRRPELATQTQSGLDKVCVLLRTQTGHDFSPYKTSTLYRRVERRMGLHQIDRLVDYVRFLQESPQEAHLLFKEMLIGVTRFFRDPLAWEVLEKALPALVANRKGSGVLRAWVPACSTGEEAYSLAMVLRQAVTAAKAPGSMMLQVFATDLDQDAIERARQGLYPPNIAGDVSADRLRRFFVKEERGYRVAREIRELVTFANQDVITDPPFTRLDVLSCRNLLIYLEPEPQRRLLPMFHYSLNQGGLLLLGSAETVGPAAELFTPLDGKARLYRRVERPVTMDYVRFPTPTRQDARQAHALPGRSRDDAPANLQTLADRVVLQRFAPAAVLTTAKGDILYTSGRTGRFLEPAAGKANWNLHAMARDGLRFALARAFQAAVKRQRTVTAADLRLKDGHRTHTVSISVEMLKEPEALHGLVLTVFTEAPAAPSAPSGKAPRKAAPSARVELELRRARAELQSTMEEMQASQEELKAANEELQSTNEELQSTNEELTTSKEEMQSLNEELQTVNQELQSKVDELSRASTDMKNLLDSTDIATLFLDCGLRVRRFTSTMTGIINLIPSDLERPITDLASNIRYPDLAQDAQEVLRTLVFKTREVTTTDGRWFSARIMPYRTMEDRIDGLVITFMDISAAKTLETRLRASNSTGVGEAQ